MFFLQFIPGIRFIIFKISVPGNYVKFLNFSQEPKFSPGFKTTNSSILISFLDFITIFSRTTCGIFHFDSNLFFSLSFILIFFSSPCFWLESSKKKKNDAKHKTRVKTKLSRTKRERVEARKKEEKIKKKKKRE